VRTRRIGVALLAAILGAGLATGTAQAAPTPTPTGTRYATPPTNPTGKAVKGGVHALKGNPRSTGVSTLASGGPWFDYNKGSQGFTGTLATGISAGIRPQNPYLDTSKDYHSLAEIDVEKTIGGNRNIVELGWTKDPTVCAGKTNTLCLFVFWWKNGVAQCYNGCGWVDYVPTPPTVNIDAGDAIPAADINSNPSKVFYITHFNSAWWASYDGKWLGWYPDTLWTASNAYGPAVAGFTDADFSQAWGEVAVGETSAGSGVKSPSCSDMGTGTQGSTGALPAGFIGNLAFDNIPLASVNASVSSVATGTLNPYFTVFKASGRTFYYGGTGWNSARTGAGSIGSC
jgi:hypothetical protein